MLDAVSLTSLLHHSIIIETWTVVSVSLSLLNMLLFSVFFVFFHSEKESLEAELDQRLLKSGISGGTKKQNWWGFDIWSFRGVRKHFRLQLRHLVTDTLIGPTNRQWWFSLRVAMNNQMYLEVCFVGRRAKCLKIGGFIVKWKSAVVLSFRSSS